MPTNQKVRIELTAQDKTKAAFQSANSRIKSLKAAGSAIAKTFAALSGAATLGSVAMGSFAKRATEAQKPLIDMADLIGASSSELSQLAIAGDLAGVGVTQLTTGLQRQTRRISEAAQGTGEAVKALKELGLEASNLNRLSPERQFQEIARAMRDVGNRGDQIRLAMRLWDSEGVKLLNTIDNIEKAQRIALETGATLTEKEVQAFNDMADAITRTDAAYRSLGQTVVSTGLGKRFEELKAASLGILETWVKLAVTGSIWDAIASGVLRLVGATERADEIMAQILDRFEAIDASPIAEATNNVDALGTSINNLSVDKFQDFIQSMRDANQVLELRERGLSDQAEITAAVIALEKQLGRAVTEGEETTIAAEIQLRNELKDSIKSQADEQARLNSVYEAAKNPANELTQTFADLNTLYERGDINLSELSERVFELQEGFEGLAEKTEETRDRMSVFAEQAARNMQDSFAEFLFDPFVEDGLKGMLDGFVITLRQMAAQAAAASIFESLGSGLSGSSNSIISGIGSFFATRATGGPLDRNQPAIVGERGPELFIPSTSGMVVPNNQLATTGGITVNVTAPSGRDSRSASQFGFEIASALSLAQRRNG